MLLNKVQEKGIDLFILIKDEMKHLYVPHPYMVHADYKSFQLVFKFEDWTGIIDDGKTHIYIIAEYINADDSVLCKWQDEDFDKLLDVVKEWNDKHRIQDEKKIKTFWDYIGTLPQSSTIWTYAMNFAKKLHNEGKNPDEHLDEVINSVENVKTKVKDYDV